MRSSSAMRADNSGCVRDPKVHRVQITTVRCSTALENGWGFAIVDLCFRGAGKSEIIFHVYTACGGVHVYVRLLHEGPDKTNRDVVVSVIL